MDWMAVTCRVGLRIAEISRLEHAHRLRITAEPASLKSPQRLPAVRSGTAVAEIGTRCGYGLSNLDRRQQGIGLIPLHLEPDQPISGQILTLDDGIFFPATNRRQWKLAGGVRTADGAEPVAAACWHLPNAPAAVPPPVPSNVAQDPRTALFLGHYSPMFGHFLLESTSRLWWFDGTRALPDVVLMLKPKGVDPCLVERKMRDFAALCGIDLPVFFWPETPTRFRRMIVPPQGSGALNLMMGTPEHRHLMTRLFGRDIAPQGGDKIYISRTGLDGKHGSLAEEDRLERLLAAQGYEIFHPQEHSFVDQIARYKAATFIVGVDGSAFHAVALVAGQGEKHIAIIQRRPAPEARLQAEQMRLYGAADVNLLPCEATGWSPAGTRRALLSLFGMLDFPATGQRLVEAGFIADAGAWVPSVAEERTASLCRIGAEMGADLYEVQRGRTDLSGFPAHLEPGSVSLIGLETWQGTNR